MEMAGLNERVAKCQHFSVTADSQVFYDAKDFSEVAYP
jgi:hypothetical protein